MSENGCQIAGKKQTFIPKLRPPHLAISYFSLSSVLFTEQIKGALSMKLSLLACIVLCFVVSLPQTVFAEIYKCKTSKGKIIYSESPCDGMTSQRMDVIDNSLDSSSLRREAKNSSTTVVTNSSVSGNQETTITRTTTASTAQPMSEQDKQNRIRENQVVSRSLTATDEKKNDAMYENTRLNKTVVNALDHEDNVERSNLKVDLDSMDQPKRSNAMNKLQSLYNKY